MKTISFHSMNAVADAAATRYRKNAKNGRKMLRAMPRCIAQALASRGFDPNRGNVRLVAIVLNRRSTMIRNERYGTNSHSSATDHANPPDQLEFAFAGPPHVGSHPSPTPWYK